MSGPLKVRLFPASGHPGVMPAGPGARMGYSAFHSLTWPVGNLTCINARSVTATVRLWPKEIVNAPHWSGMRSYHLTLRSGRVARGKPRALPRLEGREQPRCCPPQRGGYSARRDSSLHDAPPGEACVFKPAQDHPALDP
jgi:hypothetical protein